MYRRVLAFDYDGTLAGQGFVPLTLQDKLKDLHSFGCALFLVTGRHYQSIYLGELAAVFDGIIWENGAVLAPASSTEVYMPFGYVDPNLINALEAAAVPLEEGLAIAATWAEHEETVLRIVSEQGGDTSVIRNKGAVMIMPPGATKGTGLEKLLKLTGFSPRNLVSFGDAENDISLLRAGEIGVAVADAVPSLKAAADMVTTRPGPEGVLEVLEAYWENEKAPDIPAQHSRWISLGVTVEDQTPFHLPAAQLAGHNLGVFGDSGIGKSWVAGLIVEGMHLSGYQVLVIDLEGDYREMNILPRVVAFDGTPETLAAPEVVVTLFAETDLSVVIDMSAYPVALREGYLAEVLHMLGPLRKQKFRPHWILLEEAQQCLSRPENVLIKVLLPLLEQGGCGLVSYRPDLLGHTVLQSLHLCLLQRLTKRVSEQAVREQFDIPPDVSLAEIPDKHALFDGVHLLRLPSEARRVEHVRHLHKYLDRPLPRHKRFYFRDENGYLALEAGSLSDFNQILTTLPCESIEYHCNRGDFVAWIREALNDAELAEQIRGLHQAHLTGEALRMALLTQVGERLDELLARH